MKILAKIKKRFTVTKTVLSTAVDLKVIIISPDADNFSEALGISDERSVELFKIVEASIINKKGQQQSLEEISKHAKHPNELVFMSYYVGVEYERCLHAQMGRELFEKLLGKNPF